MRLVSLLPSARTEIVYALGLGDDLAGVAAFECDEAPAARAEKVVVVGGRDTSGMTPGDIDRYVRSQLSTWPGPVRHCTRLRWPTWTPT